MRKLLIVLILCGFSAPAFAVNPSGLPLPRFVSLKSDETNIRTGPGTRYPIQWVFKRAHMPVEVVDEFDTWRKIRDKDGTTGWVHHTMLSGKRYAMITGKEARTLHIDAADTSKPLFKAAPEVVGALTECAPVWCRLQVSGRKAWIQKDYLWGVYPPEVFD
jgi:SH3-like domain-containing protein